jgi:hypothetical protein
MAGLPLHLELAVEYNSNVLAGIHIQLKGDIINPHKVERFNRHPRGATPCIDIRTN